MPIDSDVAGILAIGKTMTIHNGCSAASPDRRLLRPAIAAAQIWERQTQQPDQQSASIPLLGLLTGLPGQPAL